MSDLGAPLSGDRLDRVLAVLAARAEARARALAERRRRTRADLLERYSPAALRALVEAERRIPEVRAWAFVPFGTQPRQTVRYDLRFDPHARLAVETAQQDAARRGLRPRYRFSLGSGCWRYARPVLLTPCGPLRIVPPCRPDLDLCPNREHVRAVVELAIGADLLLVDRSRQPRVAATFERMR